MSTANDHIRAAAERLEMLERAIASLESQKESTDPILPLLRERREQAQADLRLATGVAKEPGRELPNQDVRSR